jgi:hypothetical protein
MHVLHREWEMLLELARMKGWEAERGDVDRYASGGPISRTDASGMAAAIRRALPDVPAHYADGLTEEERTKPRTLEEMKARPGGDQRDPFAYFSGRGRTTLINFANKMASGAFEAELMPGFSPEF